VSAPGTTGPAPRPALVPPPDRTAGPPAIPATGLAPRLNRALASAGRGARWHAAGRPRAWARMHRASLTALGLALVLVGLATAWNLQGWPGRVDDDEGTYVAQAWAMISQHHLASYTYWYDHPPLGWAQIAGYIWLTDGFARYPSAVMAGREFMLVITLASSVLLFVLARRLEFRRTTAAVAVVLFGLSPLAVYYHRMVSLDNIGVLWLLAAMVAATSRRRNLAAAFWAGVFSAVAVLSKETIGLLLPVVFWIIWQQAQRHTRKWHLAIYGTTFLLLTAFYPLYAALRGELLPGSGHVSLIWALWWQLFERTGSGFIFGAGGAGTAHGLLTLWLGTDRWLIGAGVALVPAGLLIRRLRPLALALLIQVAMAMTGGYLPFFYVTAMIPFAALLIGGIADTLWERASSPRVENACRLLVVAAAIAALVLVVPQWSSTLVRQASQNGAAASLTATAWVEQHVPRNDVVVVDDYLWPDLKRAGLNPLWDQKAASDTESQGELPDGWRSIDYIVLTSQVAGTLGSMPLLQQAFDHSVPVAGFPGGIVVRRVVG
jgi:4-amino-4-deoxy-L-arabinose transferase-like glycosyltransferase